MPFKRISSRQSYESKIFSLEFRDYEDSNGNKHKDLAVLNSRDAANVVALTEDLDLIMIQQFRFGIEQMTIEVPGGLLEESEDPLISVKREFLEETGFEATNWIYLGKVYSNPVFQNNFIHHYLATGAFESTGQSLDPEEEIEVIKMPMKEVLDKFTNGFFKTPHTVTALNLAAKHLQQML